MGSEVLKLIDKRKLNKSLRDIEKIGNRLNEIPKIIKKYQKEYLSHAEVIFDSVIEDFYMDYTPKYYSRKEDLANVYRVFIGNGGEYLYDIGPEFMEHHGDMNDYIYQNSFIDGYHGGAIDGEEHPSPGTPWWRTGPGLQYWGRKATQFDGSPYIIAKTKIEDYLDEIIEEKVNEANTLLDDIYTDLMTSFMHIFK